MFSFNCTGFSVLMSKLFEQENKKNCKFLHGDINNSKMSIEPNLIKSKNIAFHYHLSWN